MSESNELKRIKKLYGEKFMHLCRELFPTILEEEGKLLEILESLFATNSRTLGEDLTKDYRYEKDLKNKFKNLIFSNMNKENEDKIDIGDKTPYELLEEAGYNLYECKSEEEIQEFKKYYQQGEELCTFKGGRLNRCVVFWAVKKDVDKIKRENFKEPKREDKYGTSVMSIQFTRGKYCTVSIKNRYNHTVNNPDATYGNDLDRIVPGLKQSFEKLLSERGMKLNSLNKEKFEIPGYIVANDGRYYKYNHEINFIYYCPGNVIIDFDEEVKELESEKQELIDYFILDKKEKKLKLYDSTIKDSFIECFKNIEKIDITKNLDKERKTRIISIKTKDNETPIIIEIDKDNTIVGYENQELQEVDNDFLYSNKNLSQLNLPQLVKVGDSFLHWNSKLEQLSLPRLKETGNYFLYFNQDLSQLNLPQLKETGKDFLSFNEKINKLILPQIEKVGDCFLHRNRHLRNLDLPHLKEIGNDFMYNNKDIEHINLPQLKEVGDNFLLHNETINKLNLPYLKKVGDCFLFFNKQISELNLSKLKETGNQFLECNKQLNKLFLPQLTKAGDDFIASNKIITEINLPQLEKGGKHFLRCNEQIKIVSLPQLDTIGNCFLEENESIEKINLPKLRETGDWFLYNNKLLKQLYLPRLEYGGFYFLQKNPNRYELINNMYKEPNISPKEVALLDINSKLTCTELSLGQKIIRKIKSILR